MDDFLAILNKKYGEKYSYIRVKSVDVLKYSKKIYITLYVPEDVFDYEFENEDAKAIKSVIEEIVNQDDKIIFSVYLYFEKIYYDEDILRSAITDFIRANYPYVGANIDFERMELSFERDLSVVFVIQESVYDYSQKSGFEEGVKRFLEDKYFVKCNITYDVVEDIRADTINERADANIFRSVFIPVKDAVTICGTDIKGANPKHIATINKAGDNISICGKMEIIDCKIWDEKKAIEGKRFYKYHYVMNVDDTSSIMRVLYNTNDENCVIIKLPRDSSVLIKGRVFYQEQTGRMTMFAKSIATCTIDFETLKAQLAPLEPPKEYKYLPKTFEDNVGYQLRLDLFDTEEKEQKKKGKYVALHYLSIPKVNDEIIFEIAMLRIVDGKYTEYYSSYIKAPKHESMNIEAKAKVVTAPRITSLIPDIVKFTKGYTIIAIDVINTVKKLNDIAKPLRYVLHNELQDIPLAKGGKFATQFFALCRDNGINLKSNPTALDYSHCIAELFMKK